MSNQELAMILDEINIAYYESGAYYDTPLEDFVQKEVESIKATYDLSIIEV